MCVRGPILPLQSWKKLYIIRFPGCIHFPYQSIFEWISTKTGFQNSLSVYNLLSPTMGKAFFSTSGDIIPVSITHTERNKKISKPRKNLTVVQACVASVSSRGSSRKQGQEQKKIEWRGRGRGKKEPLLPSLSSFNLFFASALTFAQ